MVLSDTMMELFWHKGFVKKLKKIERKKKKERKKENLKQAKSENLSTSKNRVKGDKKFASACVIVIAQLLFMIELSGILLW